MNSENPPQGLEIRKPDDFHLHVRSGGMLVDAVAISASHFGKCLIMPNTIPPVTTVEMAIDYKKSIELAAGGVKGFQPVMVLYLTQNTTPEMVLEAKQSGTVVGYKLYPAGATTNSHSGVVDVMGLLPTFRAMAENGLLLLLHGEVTDTEIDVFDRETIFVERILRPLHDEVPDLKIVMEHVTTKAGVDFVRGAPRNVAATITPQHMTLNRNALFQGGLRPHHYCLPVLKREEHRVAVLEAATSGNPKFFLGTDSAPHSRERKECSCGCAGIFSAPVALSVYAEAFEEAGALDKLEAFSSENGANFYGLPLNDDRIILEREEWTVPSIYSLGTVEVVPFRANAKLRWKATSI